MLLHMVFYCCPYYLLDVFEIDLICAKKKKKKKKKKRFLLYCLQLVTGDSYALKGMF